MLMGPEHNSHGLAERSLKTYLTNSARGRTGFRSGPELRSAARTWWNQIVRHFAEHHLEWPPLRNAIDLPYYKTNSRNHPDFAGTIRFGQAQPDKRAGWPFGHVARPRNAGPKRSTRDRRAERSALLRAAARIGSGMCLVKVNLNMPLG